MSDRSNDRPPISNRLLVAKYANVLDFIQYKLQSDIAYHMNEGDYANAVIYQDILGRYLLGDILVTFVDGDTYYLHAGIEEVNDNNNLTE
jgi:hypothetical protein